MAITTTTETPVSRRRILAHDIRNYLHAISMEIQLLRTVRTDQDKFEELCKSLDEDRKAVTALFIEYQNSIGDESGS